MIPVSILSKMGVYDIQLHDGVTIKAKLIDDPDVLATSILPFKLSCTGNRVVGLDAKWTSKSSCADLLLLCSGTQCLIIQIGWFGSFPSNLKGFFDEDNICFVGIELSQKFKNLKWNSYPKLMRGRDPGVELDYLAARVLKKPNLNNCCGLKEIAKEVGIENYEVPSTSSESCPDWGAGIFSHEEIKYAIQDAYASYVIGNKLLGML